MGRKHTLALLTIVTLLASLCLAGCSNSAGALSLRVEKKTYPLMLQTNSQKPVEESEMNLYFVNDEDVPYVAISEFLPLFGSLYEDEKLGVPAITFEFEHDGDNYRAKRTDNDCAMAFNAKTDQIDFLSYDGFVQSPGDSALISLVKIGEEGMGGVSRLMKANRRSYDRQGLAVALNLAEYQIDMVEDDDPNRPNPDPEDMGVSSLSMLSNSLLYGAARAKYEPEMNILDPNIKVNQYKEVGDTAIITFDEFYANKVDYYTEADLDNPQDTIELIAAAHRQITREDSPIKNVVLDLSNNGGGDADAAAFVIAWITGESPVALRNTLTDAQSVAAYEADVNLDKQFDSSDSISELANEGKLKVYCLTSPTSFSCGNLVPAALKGMFNTSTIGQRSGGGSCIVLPCTTASGARFQISGTSQISIIKNGSFYNADTGVEVDASITDTDTMYDREKLVEYIHELK